MKGFKEIFEESIEQAGLIERLTPAHILVTLLVSMLCAVVIYIVYKVFYKGAVYSENFNILIVLTTVITTFIIMTISANIVLSLGMVGALSIVRFRAAVKDPLDIGFLFWGIAAGLTTGAGLYHVSIIGTVFIAIVYICITSLSKGKHTFLLITKYEDTADEEVKAILSSIDSKLKNKTKLKGKTELTLQVKFKKTDENILDNILAIEGVSSAVMVEFTGDYS